MKNLLAVALFSFLAVSCKPREYNEQGSEAKNTVGSTQNCWKFAGAGPDKIGKYPFGSQATEACLVKVNRFGGVSSYSLVFNDKQSAELGPVAQLSVQMTTERRPGGKTTFTILSGNISGVNVQNDISSVQMWKAGSTFQIDSATYTLGTGMPTNTDKNGACVLTCNGRTLNCVESSAQDCNKTLFPTLPRCPHNVSFNPGTTCGQ